jgi:hypothetical protein
VTQGLAASRCCAGCICALTCGMGMQGNLFSKRVAAAAAGPPRAGPRSCRKDLRLEKQRVIVIAARRARASGALERIGAVIQIKT